MTHKTWNYTRARSVVSDNLDTMDILAKCGLDKKKSNPVNGKSGTNI